MKVLITFAVDTEFAPWKKAQALRSLSRNGISFQRAAISGMDVDFVVTGMGAVNAGCAGVLMRDPYDFVIASGFAGGLRRGINVGDIVVARSVQQFGKPKLIASDADHFMRATAQGATVVDTLLSLDHVAAASEEKAALAPFADAADMESFAVLSAADTHRIPAVAIRAISDSVEYDLPQGVDTFVNPTGQVNITGVAKYVARHPGAVPAVIRLGIRSKSAAESLAHFLEAYLRSFAPASVSPDRQQAHEVAAR